MAHPNWDNVLDPMINEFTSSTENEHNWQNRQNLIKKLKGLLNQSNGDVPRNYWDKAKQIIPSMVATAASERTQLSREGCELLATMFQTLGSQMHPYIESILPTLLQISGSAKKQNVVNGNNTMSTIVQFAGYNNRLLYHICASFNDKRRDARANAPTWLTQFLRTYQRALDHNKDYPMIERALETGLNDGDVKTREGTRESFWQYFRINQGAADDILERLNNHAALALKSDKHNPHKAAAPVKAAKGESALAKIKAQKAKAAAIQSQPETKRDALDSSSGSQQLIFGGLNRLNDPGGAVKPENIINSREQERLEAEHKHFIKLGFRDEQTPIYELKNEQLMKRPSKPNIAEPKESKDTGPHSADFDTSTNSRLFLSAPVRRPRVVATPISQPQPAPRPASRGDVTKRPEARDQRIQPTKNGGQTPVIPEDKVSEMQHRPATKAHKSSSRIEQRSIATTSTSSGPTSSSSEPAGIKSPRSHLQQSASMSVLPHRHQKSNSASEPKGHTAIASTSSLDYAKPKALSSPPLVDHSSSRPDTSDTSMASSNKLIDNSKRQHVSPSEPIILPSPAKENSVQPLMGKVSADEALSKAKRSLPSITEALKQGRLDTLGYRKLKKLLMAYPGQLFTTGGVDGQYHALYNALISQVSSIEEAAEPRSAQVGNLNHPIYTRMVVIDMLHSLMEQYPFGEPIPGMTLGALLISKASYDKSRVQMDEKITSSINFFLKQVLDRFNPLPVIDSIAEALLELSEIMISNQPERVATPTWTRLLRRDIMSRPRESSNGDSVMSHISDFGSDPPQVPSRLLQVMNSGIITITYLTVNAREQNHQLFSTQQERLGELLAMCLNTFRQLLKKQIMEFAAALFDIIKPEDRFRRLFTDEADLNLAYYCIAKIRERQGRDGYAPILGKETEVETEAAPLDATEESSEGGAGVSALT